MKLLPWKSLVRRFSKSYGFPDPLWLMSRLNCFAQPSEIQQPLELLRSGAVFHARGLINTQAIQHNMDWVWPYWVEKQFNPLDESFVPRAFSFTHVNLTHRNWTGLGVPGLSDYPIVDPAGLLTPFWDSWSIDAWILARHQDLLLPSRNASIKQMIGDMDTWCVITELNAESSKLMSQSVVRETDNVRDLSLTLRAESNRDSFLVISFRPYNPEGISFIDHVSVSDTGTNWTINRRQEVKFTATPDRVVLSNYGLGDVHSIIKEGEKECISKRQISCEIGMATGAALFELKENSPTQVSVKIPLSGPPGDTVRTPNIGWKDVLQTAVGFKVPNTLFNYLFETSLRTIILLSPKEVYPGPYTYRRFWFRDSAFILKALLIANLPGRVKQAFPEFCRRQTKGGYFLSQEGEWDSNGEALWLLGEYFAALDEVPQNDLLMAIKKGALWIKKKLIHGAREGNLHDGLLPPGFSAEHFGPSDFYYWDNFWALAGLRAAAGLINKANQKQIAEGFIYTAESLEASVWDSIGKCREYQRKHAVPASPYRRMDAGAIGAIVASYPLGIVEPDNPQILGTIEFLLNNCFVNKTFFQDMIHSGLNPYLTLHVAQVLLRAGDSRYMELVEAVSELASATGQWPEAVHPRTGGGCMGDGHHAWASAEWIIMMRNLFVREEDDGLIFLSGIPATWLLDGEELLCGPTLTSLGTVRVEVSVKTDTMRILIRTDFHRNPSQVVLHIPGRGQRKLHLTEKQGEWCEEVSL